MGRAIWGGDVSAESRSAVSWLTFPLAAVAVGTTAAGWSALFVGNSVAWMIVAAAVFGALLGWRTLGAPATVAAGVLVIAVAVIAGDPLRLATAGILMAVQPRVLLFPLAVTVVAAWWTASCWQPASPRSALASLPLLAAVPVALAHTAGAAFTISVRPLGLGLGIATVLAVTAGVLASRFRAWNGSGPLLAFGALMAVVGATGVWLGGDSGFDLRGRLSPPIRVVSATSPLSILKSGLVEETPEPVFTIAVAGLEPGMQMDRIPAAVLDVYDGAVWSSSASFVPAGAVLAAPAETQPVGPDVEFDVELTGRYPFEQLPLPGQLRTITSGELLWDGRTGGVVAADDLATFGGTAAPWLPPAGGRLEPGGIGGYVALPPDVPIETIDQFLTASLSGNDRGVWLDQLNDALRAAGYSDRVPAGHSVAALSGYLEGTDGVTVGFAEQAAAAFAVSARRLDIPARVVVGYRLEEPLSADNAEVVVYEDEIDAWPEVWMHEQGWVRFEPTDYTNQSPASSLAPPGGGDGADDPSTASEAALPPLEEPVALPETLDPEPEPRWWLLLVLAPLAYFGFVVLAKWLRRAFRRRGGPNARVIGAWRETTDKLRDAGQHPAAVGTVIDLREQLTDGDPDAEVAGPLSVLADDVDVAVYSPDGATADNANSAWAASDDAIDVLRSEWSPATRTRAALSVRSLVPSRRR